MVGGILLISAVLEIGKQIRNRQSRGIAEMLPNLGSYISRTLPEKVGDREEDKAGYEAESSMDALMDHFDWSGCLLGQ